jgi:hypothetical protein
MIDNRFKLGFFPTPLHRLNNLSEMYPDYSIYIKRDDQTGLASGGTVLWKGIGIRFIEKENGKCKIGNLSVVNTTSL